MIGLVLVMAMLLLLVADDVHRRLLPMRPRLPPPGDQAALLGKTLVYSPGQAKMLTYGGRKFFYTLIERQETTDVD